MARGGMTLLVCTAAHRLSAAAAACYAEASRRSSGRAADCPAWADPLARRSVIMTL